MLFPRHFSWLARLLFAVLSLPVAIATGPAGAFERIGSVYQTYRIAVETWGADQLKILPGLAKLTGTHPNGGANFREMINYLDIEDFDEDFWKEGGVNIVDPEPYETAKFMYYNGNTELFKLERVFVGEKQTFPDVLAKIRTVLTDAHTEMAAKGELAKIQPYRDRLEVCHQEALRFRQSDMEGGDNGAKSMAADIKKKWGKTAVVKVDTTDWAHGEEWKIFKLNVQETFDSSPAGLFTFDEVDTYVKSYGTDEADSKKAKNHFNVLNEHRSTQTVEAFLTGKAAGPTAC